MIEEKKEQSVENSEKIEATGRPVKSIRIVCSKHGIVNQGSYFVRYTNYRKDPDNPENTIAVDNNNVFCMACLNELYQKFQQDGTVGKISLKVDFEDEDTKPRELPPEENNG